MGRFDIWQAVAVKRRDWAFVLLWPLTFAAIALLPDAHQSAASRVAVAVAVPLRGRNRRTRWLHSCALLSVAGVTPPSPQTLTRHEGRPATPQQLPHARWVAGRYNAGGVPPSPSIPPWGGGTFMGAPRHLQRLRGGGAFVCRRRFGRARTGYLWCVAVARPLPKSGPTGTLRVGRRALAPLHPATPPPPADRRVGRPARSADATLERLRWCAPASG